MKRVKILSFPLWGLGLFAIFLLTGSMLLAQEVTGNVQGVVKDQSGAVIPGVEVTAASAQRTVSALTDDTGTYRFNNLQPGVYMVTAKMAGFQDARREKITVEVGRTLQVNLDMTPAGAATTITVTGNQEPIVDVTSSKTATNITQGQIDLLAKGINFSTVLEIAPGTRFEGKAGGFQIDGASGAENTFVVDGVEVTRIVSGTLGSTKNIPLEFVNEVQVKSAGYEAEYGGATGGVVNVVTKSGTNDFHGELRLEFTSDRFRAKDNPSLRLNPLDPTQLTPEYFRHPFGKDKTRFLNPNYALGGPIVKDKLWFFASYAPVYNRTTQTTQLIKPIAPGDTKIVVLNERQLQYKTRDDYAIGRLDYVVSPKLTLYGNYIWTPTKAEGGLIGLQTSSTSVFNGTRYGFRGGYAPAWQTAFGANYTLTPKIILSFRGGKTYLNDKGGNYDTPVGINRIIISTPCDPSKFGSCPAGTTTTGDLNINADFLTQYDITTRWNLNGDASFITKLFGQQHIFRGGYQTNLIGNNVLAGTSVPRMNIYYDRKYRGQTGAYGYYRTYFFSRQGDVSSSNQGYFIQDQWQIHKRVTLNLGLRFEKEFLPSYPITAQGHPDISAEEAAKASKTNPIDFGWSDKIAPRIGGAWDVFGNSKLKVSGSYSVFYDTMKYELPRGSFGGEIYLVSWRALDSLDPNQIKLTGYGTDGPGKLIFGPVDYRFPSNITLPGDRPGIDPKLKPFKEHEYTGMVEYAFTPTMLLSGRLTHKALDRAIEDIGGLDDKGNEVYTIGNPGFGAAVEFFNPPTPKAIRKYTGLEVRLDKRFSRNWYANLSWVNSKLYGNYGGLASSDEDGRTSPNVNRYFDLPELVYDTHGKQYLGRLQTDRPNTFKAFGAYDFNWHILGAGVETQVGFSQFIYQGIPITTSLTENTGLGGASIYPEGRGDLGRTPVTYQTDLLFSHFFKVSENSRIRVGFNVTNLFDARRTTDLNRDYLAGGQVVQYKDLNDLLTSNGDWQKRVADQKLKLNPLYKLSRYFQGPRVLRWAVGYQF